MKTIAVLAFAFAAVASGQLISDFHDTNPLTASMASFGGDIYSSPNGWQEIGGVSKVVMPSTAYSGQFKNALDLPENFLYDTRTWGVKYRTVPNPAYDPSRPIGIFNPGPPTIDVPYTVQTGGTAFFTQKLDLLWAQGENIGSKWRLTLYDKSGSSAYYDFGGDSPGAFRYTSFLGKDAVGTLDWNTVNQFSISGVGDGPFHAAFDELRLGAVPEPKEWAIVSGIALLGFGILRRQLG